MDEEASIRLITTLNLRRLKYGVEEAEDGEEAIKVRCSMLHWQKRLLAFINFDIVESVETNLLCQYD